MSNIVLARLGENIKASVAGDILVSSGPTTAPTLNALVGSIALFAGTTAPAGWLKCDGTGGLLRSGATGYPDLWAFANSSGNLVTEAVWLAGTIGSFSSGNLSTTFRIPDLRGEFVRALADGKAVDTGRVIGSYQADAFQGHQHGVSDPGHAHNVAPYVARPVTGTSAIYSTNDPGPSGTQFTRNATTGLTVTNPTTDNANGTPRTAVETRPRNIALLYCIKF